MGAPPPTGGPPPPPPPPPPGPCASTVHPPRPRPRQRWPTRCPPRPARAAGDLSDRQRSPATRGPRAPSATTARHAGRVPMSIARQPPAVADDVVNDHAGAPVIPRRIPRQSLNARVDSIAGRTRVEAGARRITGRRSHRRRRKGGHHAERSWRGPSFRGCAGWRRLAHQILMEQRASKSYAPARNPSQPAPANRRRRPAQESTMA